VTELEKHIIALVVKETGTEGKSVDLTSRLSHDIGMDGDDAVEFFEKFGEQFHVDLNALGNHWHQHFVSEGTLGVPCLSLVVGMGAAVLVGVLLPAAVRWNRAGAAALAIALIAVTGWVFSSTARFKKAPVTVQDLVDAATSGKWVKQHDRAAALFSSDDG
jgi:hypothetical protein